MNLKDRKILIKVEIYLFFLGKVLRKKKNNNKDQGRKQKSCYQGSKQKAGSFNQ